MTNAEILKRYAVVCLLTIVAVMVIAVLLDMLAGIDMGAGGGIVSVIVPAMEAGQTFARRTGTAPEKPRMWRLALLFTLINFAIGLVLLVVLSAIVPMGLAEAFAVIGPVGFLLILVIFLGLYTLAGRFFLGFGARNELKRQEKLSK